MSTPCFLVDECGTRAWLRIYWRDPAADHLHNALSLLGDCDRVGDRVWAGAPADYPADRWPTHCETCGQPVPPAQVGKVRAGPDGQQPVCQVFYLRLFAAGAARYVEPGRVVADSLPSGAMFWTTWHDTTPCWEWDNCDGRHLQVVLPNGRVWEIDGRASNCTLPEDRRHRCWVRHGTPPQVTVDKVGQTCAAGAGSILSGSYHGFLRDGVLTP